MILILDKKRGIRANLFPFCGVVEGRAAVGCTSFLLLHNRNEITALETIRSVITAFNERLNIPPARLKLSDDDRLLETADSLIMTKIKVKE